jgi:hypothetical protein
MPSLPTARLLLLGAAIALPGACKRSAPPADPAATGGPPATPAEAPRRRTQVPRLGAVSVEDFTPPPERPKGVDLDLPALEARITQRLAEAGIFGRRAGDAGAEGPTARVRVELALEVVIADKKGAARTVVRLRIDARPSDLVDPHWNEDVRVAAEHLFDVRKTPDRRPVFDTLVTRVLDDLLGTYIGRQQLWVGDPAHVRAALGADAGELRMEAIRAVAERRLAEEVPTLLRLLDAPDEPLRDAALGALVELRERQAVAVLTRQRDVRDRREMRKILDAIATIGGPEAKDYLAFIADGHEDEEIRKIAADARKRLERREQGGTR